MLVFRDTETKGRGIFAQQDFAKGDLIERAAVIVIPKQVDDISPVWFDVEE